MSSRWRQSWRARARNLARRKAGGMELLEGRWCPAAAPQLLADINAVALPSEMTSPSDLTSVDNKLYFVATADAKNLVPAVWESDGTDAGTRIVVQAAIASHPIVANGRVMYFGGGGELTLFDGQSSTLLASLGRTPRHVRSWTERTIGLFDFDGADAQAGLWRTDGTQAGTFQLVPGQTAVPYYWNGKALVARVDLPSNQLELWVTDGSAAGTTRLANWTNPAGAQTYLYSMRYHQFGSNVYFSFADSIHGYELWRTDGTEAGTRIVMDIRAGRDSAGAGPFATLADRFYFTAGLSSGSQLHSSDGTGPGTRQERLLNPNGSGVSVRQMFTVGNKLVLEGNQGTFRGASLAVSDGTFAGTVARSWDDLGRWVEDAEGFGYRVVGVIGDHVLVARSQAAVSQGAVQYDIWSWNVAAGSVSKLNVPELQSLGASLPRLAPSPIGGRLAMQLTSPQAGELFIVSDGTSGGTQVLGSFRQLDLSKGVRHGDRLYFPAQRDDRSNLTVWTWDGTTTVPTPLKSIVPPTNDSAPRNFVRWNDTIYFLATPDQSGTRRLYRTDGTPEGTVAISGSIQTNNPIEFLLAGTSRLYFSVNRELWRSDGTETGTYRIRANVNIDQPFVVGDRLYFYGGASMEKGAELWTSDGTSDGTVMVRDMVPGANSSDIHTLGKWQDLLIFSIDAGNGNRSLWVTDGTSIGTRRLFTFTGGEKEFVVGLSEQMLFTSGPTVRRFNPVTISSTSIGLPGFRGATWVEPAGSGAVIAETISSNGGIRWRIWSVDDTSAGTKIIERNESSSGGILPLHAVDASLRQVVFIANERRSIWRTDGTTEGTLAIGDLTAAQSPPSDHTWLMADNGKVYGVVGQIAWQIDEHGLTMIKNPDAYHTVYTASNQLLVGEKLYYAAFHPKFGIEPYIWSLPLTDATKALPQPPAVTQVSRSSADGNGDGRIDSLDLAELMALWTGPLSSPGMLPADSAWADLDGDGDIDSSDLLDLMAYWTPAQESDLDVES